MSLSKTLQELVIVCDNESYGHGISGISNGDKLSFFSFFFFFFRVPSFFEILA